MEKKCGTGKLKGRQEKYTKEWETEERNGGEKRKVRGDEGERRKVESGHEEGKKRERKEKRRNFFFQAEDGIRDKGM